MIMKLSAVIIVAAMLLASSAVVFAAVANSYLGSYRVEASKEITQNAYYNNVYAYSAFVGLFQPTSDCYTSISATISYKDGSGIIRYVYPGNNGPYTSSEINWDLPSGNQPGSINASTSHVCALLGYGSWAPNL